MEKRVFGHGDVMVVKTAKIPKGAEPLKQKTKNPTLAFGEVTGHSHQISKGVAALFTFNEKTYMEVKSKIACLTHEEHHEIEIPEGTYEIGIQREYSPEGWKKVID
jgi:hypothetical protein